MLTIYVQNGNKVGFSLLFGVGCPPVGVWGIGKKDNKFKSSIKDRLECTETNCFVLMFILMWMGRIAAVSALTTARPTIQTLTIETVQICADVQIHN